MKELSAIDAILARRSIRSYEDKPVEREKIDTILKCACAAPSANNFRPWHFVAVTERAALNALADAHPYGKMLAQATFAVVVCAEKERNGDVDVWWEQDCGAAMQNILLAATGLGLGSVWLGVHHNRSLSDKIRGILGIPSHIQTMGIAAIGYGAESKPPHEDADPQNIHKERW